MKPLSYTSDADRAYGAAGMAIGLIHFDGEDYIASIDIDRSPDDILELVPDFYFAGNPEFSAKSSWNRMVRNYNLALVMLISNVMCRNMVQRNLKVDTALHNLIRATALDEGLHTCGLDHDETGTIFEKYYNYINRLFSHYAVKSLADDFASALTSRRSMTHAEILDRLQSLNML